MMLDEDWLEETVQEFASRNNRSDERYSKLLLAVVLVYLGQTKEWSFTMILFKTI